VNRYALVKRAQGGTCIVDTVQATTQAQAARKLYRANHIAPAQAAAQGYAVEFQKPTTVRKL
jgi:hypothetical protein